MDYMDYLSIYIYTYYWDTIGIIIAGTGIMYGIVRSYQIWINMMHAFIICAKHRKLAKEWWLHPSRDENEILSSTAPGRIRYCWHLESWHDPELHMFCLILQICVCLNEHYIYISYHISDKNIGPVRKKNDHETISQWIMM